MVFSQEPSRQPPMSTVLSSSTSLLPSIMAPPPAYTKEPPPKYRLSAREDTTQQQQPGSSSQSRSRASSEASTHDNLTTPSLLSKRPLSIATSRLSVPILEDKEYAPRPGSSASSRKSIDRRSSASDKWYRGGSGGGTHPHFIFVGGHAAPEPGADSSTVVASSGMDGVDAGPGGGGGIVDASLMEGATEMGFCEWLFCCYACESGCGDCGDCGGC